MGGNMQSNDKIIHLHIPKTAGTSLLMLFREWYGIDNVVNSTNEFPLFVAKQNKTNVISGHFPYTENFEYYKWVTFVRHPIDRLKSFYFYTQTRGKKNKRNHWWNIIKDMTLDEWLESDVSKNLMTKQFAGLTALDELTTEDVDRAYRNVSKFHFIGLQENFNTDVRKLAFMLGKNVKTTPHMLPSKNDGLYDPSETYGNTHDVVLYDYIKLLR